ARSPELLMIFAIALAAAFAAIGDHLGFGKELGGLLAGVALASTPYREAIAARLAPLRDFLLLFFFIALGSKLELSHGFDSLLPAIILSLFVLIGNPLIVLAIMGAMGYRKRTGFLAGLTVAQISEFSLIFMAMGVALGHVQTDALGLVTLVGLITIAASTYMITYSHQLYRLFEPLLTPFERRRSAVSDCPDAAKPGYDVIVFGLGRFGAAIAKRLDARDRRVLAIDVDPVAVRRWREHGGAALYGDAADPEFVATLPLHATQWVISAIPDHNLGLTHEEGQVAVIHGLRRAGYEGRIAVRSRDARDTPLLQAAGADLVLEPFEVAANSAIELIETAST
ncbi:MAG: NAD-binding protein, partial [Hyphomicrobiaceae bacterium]